MNPKNIIMWALTYRCNMSCEYCYVRQRTKTWDELDDNKCLELSNALCGSFFDWKPDAIWLTGGEPTLKPILSDVVRLFEKSNIKTVITTNGLCSEDILSDLVISKPRGITISIESLDSGKNNLMRGFTENIIKSIKWIRKYKDPYTILGVSCVITSNNLDALTDFAIKLDSMGVEYLSLNPIIGYGGNYSEEYFVNLNKVLAKIREYTQLMIPSQFYFDLVADYHTGKRSALINCPATEQYVFISPWGELLPCSNEIWQNNKIVPQTFLSGNILSDFEKIRQNFALDAITTKSPCFGDRCIGCWKVYFDTIFT